MKKRLTHGFTLVEILITISICSFTITGMLGILAISLQRADSSARQTRSELAARRVITDLKLTPIGTPQVVDNTANRLLKSDYPTKPDFGPLLIPFSTSLKPIDASNPSTFHATYYANGFPGAWALVKVEGRADPLRKNISQVTITVETPAQATLANRRSHTFNTLLRFPP